MTAHNEFKEWRYRVSLKPIRDLIHDFKIIVFKDGIDSKFSLSEKKSEEISEPSVFFMVKQSEGWSLFQYDHDHKHFDKSITLNHDLKNTFAPHDESDFAKLEKYIRHGMIASRNTALQIEVAKLKQYFCGDIAYGVRGVLSSNIITSDALLKLISHRENSIYDLIANAHDAGAEQFDMIVQASDEHVKVFFENDGAFPPAFFDNDHTEKIDLKIKYSDSRSRPSTKETKDFTKIGGRGLGLPILANRDTKNVYVHAYNVRNAAAHTSKAVIELGSRVSTEKLAIPYGLFPSDEPEIQPNDSSSPLASPSVSEAASPRSFSIFSGGALSLLSISDDKDSDDNKMETGP